VRIPQAADKWIVLGALVGLATINFPYGAESFNPQAWAVECLLPAGFFTLIYVAWYGSCQLIARRRSERVRRHTRTFANGTFFVFAVVAIVVPFRTVTVSPPAKIIVEEVVRSR